LSPGERKVAVPELSSLACGKSGRCAAPIGTKPTDLQNPEHVSTPETVELPLA
jgi:hypothetical protein